ncbi:site-specific DNA-methyltransferase, partial [Myxococcota bacterium]|nr:site-specific DNA-methyltransferase [Myxococcota bacterium]MBU1534682.1 site-specific DNA-methyltransferase [Myxococcota bacterium]
MSFMFLDAFPWYMSPERDFTLYKRDTLELLPSIPDQSVDLIFADPPYFLSNGGTTCQSGRRVEVHKGEWDKSQGADENHAFNKEWLAQCQRILKPDGSMFVSGTHHVIFSIGFAMQQLDMKILNDISWYKVNPPPNLACRYFTHATESIIWASPSQRSRHYFDYQA